MTEEFSQIVRTILLGVGISSVCVAVLIIIRPLFRKDEEDDTQVLFDERVD